jgi:hypothetical protein
MSQSFRILFALCCLAAVVAGLEITSAFFSSDAIAGIGDK